MFLTRFFLLRFNDLFHIPSLPNLIDFRTVIFAGICVLWLAGYCTSFSRKDDKELTVHPFWISPGRSVV